MFDQCLPHSATAGEANRPNIISVDSSHSIEQIRAQGDIRTVLDGPSFPVPVFDQCLTHGAATNVGSHGPDIVGTDGCHSCQNLTCWDNHTYTKLCGTASSGSRLCHPCGHPERDRCDDEHTGKDTP